VRPADLLQEFTIDPTPIWPAEDERLEPIFLAPAQIEVAEFAQLDPARSAGEPEEPHPAPRRRASAISLLASFGVHLLTLIVLITGNSAPAEVSGGIPMHLVIEEAPSVPDEAPPDRSASETTDAAPRLVEGGALSAVAEPPAPPPITVAVAVPPPITVAAAVPPPQPSPPPPVPTPTVAVALEPAANQPQPAAAPTPGVGTARGDYLDYLVTLTRGHFDILPLAFLAGRHGRTTLSVLVLEDGTIGGITVKHSSGYPDIDSKIEQMVAAVGRFPPPPDTYQRPAVALDFNLTFPDALQR